MLSIADSGIWNFVLQCCKLLKQNIKEKSFNFHVILSDYTLKILE